MTNLSKQVFTTGEIADICSVAPRTVSKWIDSGLLAGYKLPDSKDRRVAREVLISFMRAHKIPMCGDFVKTFLVLTNDSTRWDVCSSLHNELGWAMKIAKSEIAAGHMLSSYMPRVVFLDGLGDPETIKPFLPPGCLLVARGVIESDRLLALPNDWNSKFLSQILSRIV